MSKPHEQTATEEIEAASERVNQLLRLHNSYDEEVQRHRMIVVDLEAKRDDAYVRFNEAKYAHRAACNKTRKDR